VVVARERDMPPPDRLFEGEEAVLHVMGDQIRETKRRKLGAADTGRLCLRYRKGRRIEQREILRRVGSANWHAVLKSSLASRRRGSSAAPTKMMNRARTKLVREK